MTSKLKFLVLTTLVLILSVLTASLQFLKKEKEAIEDISQDDIADIFNVLDPFIQAQQIKVGRRDKIDRVIIPVKEPANFRDILKNSCHVLVLFS